MCLFLSIPFPQTGLVPIFLMQRAPQSLMLPVILLVYYLSGSNSSTCFTRTTVEKWSSLPLDWPLPPPHPTATLTSPLPCVHALCSGGWPRCHDVQSPRPGCQSLALTILDFFSKHVRVFSLFQGLRGFHRIHLGLTIGTLCNLSQTSHVICTQDHYDNLHHLALLRQPHFILVILPRTLIYSLILAPVSSNEWFTFYVHPHWSATMLH